MLDWTAQPSCTVVVLMAHFLGINVAESTNKGSELRLQLVHQRTTIATSAPHGEPSIPRRACQHPTLKRSCAYTHDELARGYEAKVLRHHHPLHSVLWRVVPVNHQLLINLVQRPLVRPTC